MLSPRLGSTNRKISPAKIDRFTGWLENWLLGVSCLVTYRWAQLARFLSNSSYAGLNSAAVSLLCWTDFLNAISYNQPALSRLFNEKRIVAMALE